MPEDTVWPQGMGALPVVPGGLFGKQVDEGKVHRKLDLRLVGQQAVRPDIGDGNEAIVLAEQQVVAVLRIGNAGGAAVGMAVRNKLLQNSAGTYVEDLDGPGHRFGAQGKDGGGAMAIGEWVRVQCDGFSANPGAAAFIGNEVDLGSRRGNDLTISHNPSAASQRAGGVGWEVLGLSERRNAQPHPQQASDQAPQDPRTVSKRIHLHKMFSPQRN